MKSGIFKEFYGTWNKKRFAPLDFYCLERGDVEVLNKLIVVYRFSAAVILPTHNALDVTPFSEQNFQALQVFICNDSVRLRMNGGLFILKCTFIIAF
jgi:hypothetical protein